jgi:hypothetical protein
MKRVVVISDLHCGSDVGLTYPDWQQTALQEELWEVYAGMIDALRPIDVLIVNGDMIDGKASRWGSTGLITADRVEQAEMAVKAIAFTDATEMYLTYGTPYHAGSGEDFEVVVADKLRARIEPQLWVEVNGIVFDAKHFISASSVPHGRHTSIARDRLWNILWADMEQQPKSDVFIRSHVHYFNFAGGTSWVAMTTPALQGLGCKFGSRIPSGTVDYGLVYFDVDDDGGFSWDSDTILIDTQKNVPYIAGDSDA